MHGQGQCKGGAFVGFTDHGQISAKQTRKTAADGKPKTRSAVLTRGAGIGLLEFFKDAAERFLVHADAAVCDIHHKYCVCVMHIEDDTAFMGEFRGITQEIEHDLFDLILIGVNQRQFGVILFFKFTFGLISGCAVIYALIDKRVDVEVGGLHIHAARFDLGDIEHGVDQPKQMLGAGKNFIEIVCLLFGQDAFRFSFLQCG